MWRNNPCGETIDVEKQSMWRNNRRASTISVRGTTLVRCSRTPLATTRSEGEEVRGFEGGGEGVGSWSEGERVWGLEGGVGGRVGVCTTHPV